MAFGYSKNNQISNNNIKSDNNVSIFLMTSNNNKIYSNNIDKSTGSIATFYSSNNIIKNNKITNSEYCIILNYGSKNQISGNRLSKNLINVMIGNSNYNTILKNQIDSIKSVNSGGITLKKSKGNKIYFNKLKYGLSGIMLLSKCYNNDITSNSISYLKFNSRIYKGLGISAYKKSDSDKIRYNNLYNVDIGISISGSNKNLIQ